MRLSNFFSRRGASGKLKQRKFHRGRFAFEPLEDRRLLSVAPTTAGLYAATSSTFYLRNTASTGFANTVTTQTSWGSDNVVGVSGDWDGDGTATIGAYDHTTGTFYLINSNDPTYTPNYSTTDQNPVRSLIDRQQLAARCRRLDKFRQGPGRSLRPDDRDVPPGRERYRPEFHVWSGEQ